MRLTSLLILVAIVGGVGYVALFQRDWVAGLFTKGQQTLAGYKDAKTPTEAVEFFLKAVKKRDYEAAALYCSGEYAAQLKKTSEAASAMGGRIDEVLTFIDEKGFMTDKTRALLRSLDPFPTTLKIGGVGEEKDGKAFAGYVPTEDAAPPAALVVPPSDLQRLDARMFNNNLSPGPLLAKFSLKRTGEGDTAKWLIEFPVGPGGLNALAYYRDHHKSYLEGLNTIREEIRQGRHLKDAVFGEVVRILASSK